MQNEVQHNGQEIAVIGMAGRFPGADDVAAFWENLKNGVESVRFFSDEELLAAGVPEKNLKTPNYVKANGYMEGLEYFDAAFFGYTPQEAENLPPEVRVFHEVVWHALEDAACDPSSYRGAIGLYGGAAPDFNYQAVSMVLGRGRDIGGFAAGNLGEKDFMPLQIAYKLNLTGPAFSMYTSCSTSLVAVHLACMAILNGECDMAVAGGTRINSTGKMGYFYEEGMIHSPDGHCRAFDAEARGIVGGNGAAAVVLKRLEDALEDGDHIYAVIKGTAVNNDGSRKVGFTAPSVEGQVQVIRTALQAAEVEPESIGYIEAHGTGTPLGDPVEIESLRLAFRSGKKGYCGIGSVKTNIGHLDAAAGAAGLIKTVLALHHRQLPPSLHFRTPNPKIPFADSPFYVCRELRDWPVNGGPRRAGVSSFGIGGTNAHVVLEEAPPVQGGPSARKLHLLPLSAQNADALQRLSLRLADYLRDHPDVELADVAHTLQVGRRTWPYRRAVVCADTAEAARLLAPDACSAPAPTTVASQENRPLVFLFPGQGAQYVGMGRDLYHGEPVFRENMDRCLEILQRLSGRDWQEYLYPAEGGEAAEERLMQTEITQPLIFAVEYALAMVLLAWGLRPSAMLGHSIGEYTAACLAGVFTLEEAVNLVYWRGKLMQEMPAGAMLAVPLPEEEAAALCGPELNLAAVNSSAMCVLAGSSAAVEECRLRLQERGVAATVLHTSHAFHSWMMEPILARFGELAARTRPQPPRIPFLSNVSGRRITDAEAVDPAYWARHLRGTVRFRDGLADLLQSERAVFVEVGPGKTLAAFVAGHAGRRPHHEVVGLLRHPRESGDDQRILLQRLGRLWLAGLKPDWLSLYPGERRRRLPLPGYPFERIAYPAGEVLFRVLAKMAGQLVQPAVQGKPIDWLWRPRWEKVPAPVILAGDAARSVGWLIFADPLGLGERLAVLLRQRLQQVTVVRMGVEYQRTAEGEFTLRPGCDEDYDALWRDLQQSRREIDHVVHCWTVTPPAPLPAGEGQLDEALDRGLFSLLCLVQAMGRQRIDRPMLVLTVSDRLQRVQPQEDVQPEKAVILGAVKVIPLEYANVVCRSVDVVVPSDPTALDGLVQQVALECSALPHEVVTALRDGQRFQPVFTPLNQESEPPTPRLREKGVYVVLGGFGGMGFAVARSLAERCQARVALVGRSPFPPRAEWPARLENAGADDRCARQIRAMLQLEETGARFLTFAADIADPAQMAGIKAEVERTFGRVNGVVHAAGVVDFGGVIQKRDRQTTLRHLTSKVHGTLVLERLFADETLDFLALFSSLGNVVYRGKFGQVSYNAANEFLEAFAEYRQRAGKPFTLTINWCDWRESGMTLETIRRERNGDLSGVNLDAMIPGGLSDEQGVGVFHAALERSLPRLSVNTHDLPAVLERQRQRVSGHEAAAVGAAAGAMQPRPELSVPYAAPQSAVEKSIVAVWERFFGIVPIGVDDNFYDLGGDSLKALAMVTLLKKELQCAVSLSDLMLNPTVKELALSLFAKEEQAESLEFMVRLTRQTTGRNLFILHPLHGMIHQYMELAAALDGHCDVYAVQALGWLRRRRLPESVEIMAMEYIHQIRAVQPEGPYLIAGYCFGDMVGYTMIRMMEQLGLSVSMFVMLDEPAFLPPEIIRFYRQQEWIDRFRAPFRRVLGAIHPAWRGRGIREEYAEYGARRAEEENPAVTIAAGDMQEHKTRIHIHIENLNRKYWGAAVRRVTGLIRAPILDIPGTESHMKVDDRQVERMSKSGARIVRVAGDHNTILIPPHVAAVAETIRRYAIKELS